MMASAGQQTMETGHEDMVVSCPSPASLCKMQAHRSSTMQSWTTMASVSPRVPPTRPSKSLPWKENRSDCKIHCAGKLPQDGMAHCPRSHDGPVWQVAWAHPKFGTILASASYDAHVIIWRDSSTSTQQSSWTKLFEHTVHTSSINSIAWAPHELGALLACASSDGKVSVLEFKDDGTWDTKVFNAHGMGCNAVSWAPAIVAGNLVSTQPDFNAQTKRLATGGCDNVVKIWSFEYYLYFDELISSQEKNIWAEETTLQGHTDWVRDVAFAPSIGMPKTYLASGSQVSALKISVDP